MLANAALALDEKEEKNDDHLSVSLQDFRQYLSNLSELTANGMYKKACTLVHHVGKMTTVPGGNPKSRMVASTRLRERPHLIEKGKTEGEYKCEKTCPHYNALKLCSHVIATAEANKDLKAFLQPYVKKKDAEKTDFCNLTCHQIQYVKGGNHPPREDQLPSYLLKNVTGRVTLVLVIPIKKLM